MGTHSKQQKLSVDGCMEDSEDSKKKNKKKQKKKTKKKHKIVKLVCGHLGEDG